jgi:hypothetical protein
MRLEGVVRRRDRVGLWYLVTGTRGSGLVIGIGDVLGIMTNGLLAEVLC